MCPESLGVLLRDSIGDSDDRQHAGGHLPCCRDVERSSTRSGSPGVLGLQHLGGLPKTQARPEEP